MGRVGTTVEIGRLRANANERLMMDTLSNLQTKVRETIERYRTELPGTEAASTDPNRTASGETATVNESGANRGDNAENAGNGANTDGSNGRKPTTNSETSADAKGTGDRPGGEWHVVESPTNKSLQGVTTTAAGPFAVGTGGRVLRRSEGAWRLVVETGPATRKNRLTAIDATSDGMRVWFCGSSGALGAYDVDTGMKYDHSAPKGKTSTWEAIAVTGKKDAERVRVANGSGEVLSATIDETGCPQWGTVVKPGSGSTIAALDFGGERCYAVDTSGNVFEESAKKKAKNGPKEGNWADIGIENAQVNFADVFATDSRVLVAGGGGRVYRYDRPCGSWTPIDAGDGALAAIDGDGNRTVVVGAGGRIYQRRPENGWHELDSPVTEDLRAVALGSASDATESGDTGGDGNSNDGASSGGVDVTVGTNGTILERPTGGATK